MAWDGSNDGRREVAVNPSGRATLGQNVSARLKDLAFAELLPTPRAYDCKGGVTRHNSHYQGSNLKDFAHAKFRPDLTLKTSLLNPLYVAEMMGFPLEWLTLPFIGDDSGSGSSKL